MKKDISKDWGMGVDGQAFVTGAYEGNFQGGGGGGGVKCYF